MICLPHQPLDEYHNNQKYFFPGNSGYTGKKDIKRTSSLKSIIIHKQCFENRVTEQTGKRTGSRVTGSTRIEQCDVLITS